MFKASWYSFKESPEAQKHKKQQVFTFEKADIEG